MSNRLVEIELYALRLPFRREVVSGGAIQGASETVVAAALLADGTVGYGEGLPLDGLTGETVESVLYNVGHSLAEGLGQVEPKNFPALLDFADQLPFRNEQGQLIHSARCCVELALLDAYSKSFGCSLASIVGWLGYGPFIGCETIEPPRVSGVLDGATARLGSPLRLMRGYGLRDFKVNLAGDEDDSVWDFLGGRFEKALHRGSLTLRVDAQGKWDVDKALEMGEELGRRGVCCLEQPLAVDDQDHWQALADLSKVSLMADESLLDLEDGMYLSQNDLVDYFNISINKNGGLIPAVRLAELATQWSRGYQLGATWGESGVLAAAGVRFLQMVPFTRFTEICYGSFRLKSDILDRNIRFRYGGRLRNLSGHGLGVEVRRDRVSKFLMVPPRKISLA